MTRRLILLRHAKSDWPDVPDRDRPLAKRGRRDAPRIGRWLRDHGYLPDVVICSTALRTQQTWELVAPELDGSPSVRFEPRAYAASALTLRYLVQELPSRCRAALLIAHNPGLSELAASLAGSPAGDDGAGLRFPTAAVAVFELGADWPAMLPGVARLIDFTTPADLSLLAAWKGTRGRSAVSCAAGWPSPGFPGRLVPRRRLASGSSFRSTRSGAAVCRLPRGGRAARCLRPWSARAAR